MSKCADTVPTPELLNTIKVGDLVYCNDWKIGLRVKGVTRNYFVMTRRAFGEIIYAVCDKRYMMIGLDDLVFGYEFGYNWHDESEAVAYLMEFESGTIGMSRHAVPLKMIGIG